MPTCGAGMKAEQAKPHVSSVDIERGGGEGLMLQNSGGISHLCLV